MPSIKQLYNAANATIKNAFNKAVYRGCAVLLYHRVVNLEKDPQLLSVNPENFNEQLKLLKSKYNVLKVDEFKEFLFKKKKFPSKSILITFDDGYADNYYEALPLLEKYNLQALFYISTGCLNTDKEFWWDELERIILGAYSFPNDWEVILNNKNFNNERFTIESKLNLYESLLPELRKMKAVQRDEKIREIRELFGGTHSRASHRSLNFIELVEFSKSPSVIIGAHTHGHPSLGALSYEDQKEEILASKNILEKKLGKEIVHFSYPFGTRNDFNKETIDICRDLGFELIAANYPELVFNKSQRYYFPRFLVRDWSAEYFETQLKQFFL